MPAPSSPQLFHIHPIPVLLILTTTAVLTAPLSLLVAAIAPTPIPVEQQRPLHQIHMTRAPASALDCDASGEMNLIGSTILCSYLFAAHLGATDQSFARPSASLYFRLLEPLPSNSSNSNPIIIHSAICLRILSPTLLSRFLSVLRCPILFVSLVIPSPCLFRICSAALHI